MEWHENPAVALCRGVGTLINTYHLKIQFYAAPFRPRAPFIPLQVWSSGMWICTGTGSSAAMAAAGGQPMDAEAAELQYLIREHMIERLRASASGSTSVPRESSTNEEEEDGIIPNNGLVLTGQKLHVRWNSHKGCIFIDGSHLVHPLELGDEVMIDNKAPPLQLFAHE